MSSILVQFLLVDSNFTRVLIETLTTKIICQITSANLISFGPLVVTRPYTSHGSTKKWSWWLFECHAPAKVAVLVGSSEGRKLSLRTIESLILFAIRVATRDGL